MFPIKNDGETVLSILTSQIINVSYPRWNIETFKTFFACMFDDYLWKSYVYRTTFSNVKYQDFCVTTNLSKIKYKKVTI